MSLPERREVRAPRPEDREAILEDIAAAEITLSKKIRHFPAMPGMRKPDIAGFRAFLERHLSLVEQWASVRKGKENDADTSSHRS